MNVLLLSYLIVYHSPLAHYGLPIIKLYLDMYILNLEMYSHVRTHYRSQFMIGALTLKSTLLVSLHPFYRHLSSCYEEFVFV